MSSKGQVIIPKALRDSCQWSPGTKLELHATADGVLLRPITPAKRTPLRKGLDAIRSQIAYQGKAISVDAMHAAVLGEAAKRK
jgi:AbrB family looped-hinge helix DNA binding protein